MKLTSLFKAWIVENCDVADAASDDDFRAAAAKALADGTLSVDKFAELQVDPEEEKAAEVQNRFESMEKSIQSISDALASFAQPQEEKSEAPAVEKAVADIAQESSDAEIRVKGAHEMYNTSKSALNFPETTKSGNRHKLAGQPVVDETGRQMETPSDLDKAVAGAWWKFKLNTFLKGRAPTFGFETLPNHEKELLNYAGTSMDWDVDGKQMKGIPGGFKALIDDATSGGTEAAPIVFDDLVIQTPLLNGELFPLVNQVPIDRGRRIEGVSVANVTASWGGVDDTSISLFNTSSYVSAFDTTIHRWQGAIHVGLDFMSDTPIDFGTIITQQYGERLLEDLDDCIATGNGTTQPEGIMNKAGTTSVNFASTTSLGNYELLRFGVAKAEHRAIGNTAVFCGTEQSYQRMKSLPVGASDDRRLHGNDYSQNYQWMGVPYKINESLANTQIFYALMGGYRMYRRKGLEIAESREGDELMRRNNMLITAMARFGGQLERGAQAAVTTTAPS